MRYAIPYAILLISALANSSESTIDHEINLTFDHVRNLDGGMESGDKSLGSLDVIFSLDTNENRHWSSGEYFMYFMVNEGGDPSSLVGDLQVTSNIEAEDGARIYELWYRKALSENLHWLFGLHDYNAVFTALESSGIYLNSSFGIGPDVSQAAPSIFPETSLGLNLSLEQEQYYLLFGVYDGIAGDPDAPRGTNIKLNEDDGYFVASEWGRLFNEERGKFAVGLWHQSALTESPIDASEIDQNMGAYVVTERIFSDKFSAFMQLGYADKEKNMIAHYLGCGIQISEIFQADDQLGLAIGYARSGSPFATANPELKRNETVFEATYLFNFSSAISFQPDIQYVVNPGLEYENALVASLRLTIRFQEFM